MTMVSTKPRRSIWMNGLQADEPTEEQRQQQALSMSKRLGFEVKLPPIPRAEDLHAARSADQATFEPRRLLPHR